MENAKVMKYILKSFELLSGLKINYNKSCLFGLNTNSDMLATIASTLGCVIGVVPFSYLRIMVGSNHRKETDWK